MALNLKTFGAQGTLSYDDLDSNWTAIMDAFNNSNLAGVKLFKLNNFQATNACKPDGSNSLHLEGNIQFLNASNIFPRLQLIITLNNTIALVEDLSAYFHGNTYPFAANDEGGDIDLNLSIAAESYPASIAVYLFDHLGNFAQPVTLFIQDNPCAVPAETIELSAAAITGETPSISITGNIANGSNDFALQYDNEGAWTNISAFTQLDGAVAQSFPIGEISGTYNVRIIDTLTNNFSNTISVNF